MCHSTTYVVLVISGLGIIMYLSFSLKLMLFFPHWFLLFNCCFLLEKGAYPENSHIFNCPIKLAFLLTLYVLGSWLYRNTYAPVGSWPLTRRLWWRICMRTPRQRTNLSSEVSRSPVSTGLKFQGFVSGPCRDAHPCCIDSCQCKVVNSSNSVLV